MVPLLHSKTGITKVAAPRCHKNSSSQDLQHVQHGAGTALGSRRNSAQPVPAAQQLSSCTHHHESTDRHAPFLQVQSEMPTMPVQLFYRLLGKQIREKLTPNPKTQLLNPEFHGKKQKTLSSIRISQACTALAGNSHLNRNELKSQRSQTTKVSNCPLILDKGLRSTQRGFVYLLDNVLSCDVLKNGCRGGAGSGAPRRAGGGLARRVGCGRETCHREPRRPRSRPLHGGCRCLRFDRNGGQDCLVPGRRPRA